MAVSPASERVMPGEIVNAAAGFDSGDLLGGIYPADESDREFNF